MQHSTLTRFGILASLLVLAGWSATSLQLARAANGLQLEVPAYRRAGQVAPGLPQGDWTRLQQNLSLNVLNAPVSLQTFAVTEDSFGGSMDTLGGLPGQTAYGFTLAHPGDAVAAKTSFDHFSEINLIFAAAPNTVGDAIRVKLHGTSKPMELLRAVAEPKGFRITAVHPDAHIFIDNRFALGPSLTMNALIPFVDSAAAHGQRTGLITISLASDSPLRKSCHQLGLDLQRSPYSGFSAVVLADVVVHRNKDSEQEGRVAIGKNTVGLMGHMLIQDENEAPCKFRHGN